MPMLLPDGEPAVASWTAVDEPTLVQRVLGPTPAPTGRPRVIAVEGRSASGKTTLAARLHAAVPSSVVVHTDDLAWWEPYFAWGHLLREVLETLHRGEAVRLRPPAWDEHGREGAVEVPAGLALVVVEGVGAGQRAVADLLDRTVWVQSDHAEAERRGLARDLADGTNGDHDATVAFWHEWMGHELAFLAGERPWERADVLVAGTAPFPLAPDATAVADGPLRPDAPADRTPGV